MITEKPSLLFDAHNLGKKAGGIETYNRNLLAALKKKGEAKIFLYTNTKARFKSQKRIFVPLSDNGLYRLLYGFGKSVNKFTPKIIHANNFLPFFVSKKVKRVITVHDLCFVKEKNPLERVLFRALLAYSLASADRIIAVSRFTKKQILTFARDKISSQKISVIHHGVIKTIKTVNRTFAKNYLAKKYRLEKDFFLVVGNMTPRKNLPLIVSLARQLSTKHPSLKIVITGKREKGAHTFFPNNLVFLNYVPERDLSYLYHACLALLFPSTCEGFGLPIIEAARAKAPVVAFPASAVKEIARDTILYARDKNEWISILTQIAKGAYPKTLINKAYKNSLRFSWERAAAETLKIYDAIMKLP